MAARSKEGSRSFDIGCILPVLRALGAGGAGAGAARHGGSAKGRQGRRSVSGGVAASGHIEQVARPHVEMRSDAGLDGKHSQAGSGAGRV